MGCPSAPVLGLKRATRQQKRRERILQRAVPKDGEAVDARLFRFGKEPSGDFVSPTLALDRIRRCGDFFYDLDRHAVLAGFGDLERFQQGFIFRVGHGGRFRRGRLPTLYFLGLLTGALRLGYLTTGATCFRESDRYGLFATGDLLAGPARAQFSGLHFFHRFLDFCPAFAPYFLRLAAFVRTPFFLRPPVLVAIKYIPPHLGKTGSPLPKRPTRYSKRSAPYVPR